MTNPGNKSFRWPLPLVLAILTYVLFNTILFWGYVPTSSMEPALPTGSIIVGTRLIGELTTGDIVVFHHNGQLLIKRIAACPGDRVDRRELTYMTSEGIPIWDEPILTVPDGCYFVLGDNKENSIDSRYWTDPYIREDDIIAKLFTK